MHVSKQCIFCRKVVHIIVDEAGYQRWQGGELIQNALPNLLPAEREMIISQCCENCFDGMFGEDAERDGLGDDLPPL